MTDPVSLMIGSVIAKTTQAVAELQVYWILLDFEDISDQQEYF